MSDTLRRPRLQSVERRSGKGRNVVKVYEQVRTAHLERVLGGADNVTLLYRDKRYDFDETIADELDIRRAGLWGAWRFCLDNHLDIIESNELLAWDGAGRALAAVAGNRVRAFLTRSPRADLVWYAIENKDPAETVRRLPWRARARRLAAQPAVALLWVLSDRAAFGTEQAYSLYRCRFSRWRRWPEHRVIEALPGRPSAPSHAPRGSTLAYLGDLSRRKGFDLLAEAWPSVHALRPDSQLTILGKGAEAEKALRLSTQHPSVRTVLDPPRDEIFAVLGSTKVLILPSQPSPRWREQVGLPIVEGLGAGCIVVTTDQTGLAPWLQSNGHVVLSTPSSPAALVRGIVAALDDPRTPADLLSALPPRDGRQAAEDWLYERGSTVPSGAVASTGRKGSFA